MKYRVKQIADDKFLPQVKKNFFSRWRTIDVDDYYLWNLEVFAEKYSCCKTLESALNVIQGFKEHIKPKKRKKLIYHYIKNDTK